MQNYLIRKSQKFFYIYLVLLVAIVSIIGNFSESVYFGLTIISKSTAISR